MWFSSLLMREALGSLLSTMTEGTEAGSRPERLLCSSYLKGEDDGWQIETANSVEVKVSSQVQVS